MRSALVLVGVLLNMAFGQVCFAESLTIQSAHDDSITQTAGPMSRLDASSCVFSEMRAMSVYSHPPAGGCKDGSCVKTTAPCVSSLSKGQLAALDSAELPSSLDPLQYYKEAHADSFAVLIDDPPIPPGIDGIVMRQ